MLKIITILMILIITNYLTAIAECSKEEILKLSGSGYSKNEINNLCSQEKTNNINKKTNTMIGTWIGHYSYPSNSNRPDVPFNLIITRQDGDEFIGTVKEPNTFGYAYTDELSATVKGTIKNSNYIEFIKSMSGQGGVSHKILYKGVLKNNKIDGTWHIPGSWSGKFIADREIK